VEEARFGRWHDAVEIEDGFTLAPERIPPIDCGTAHDDSGKAGRGLPPLCGRCFTGRLARGCSMSARRQMRSDARVEGHGSVRLLRPATGNQPEACPSTCGEWTFADYEGKGRAAAFRLIASTCPGRRS